MRNLIVIQGILTSLLTGIWMTSCSPSKVDPGPVRPNILLITSEDNGPHLGCYGDPFCKTPTLDRLASEGVLFTQAYVSQAGCSQSRSSIFTGLYPHQNGQIGLATHRLTMYHASFPNVFSELKRVGYRTGIIGKIHVNPESAFPLDFHSKIKGGFSNRNVRAIADTAQNFFRAGEEPFLLMINYKDAHRPFIKQAHGLPEIPLDAGDVEILPEIGIETEPLKEQLANYYNCIMRLDTGIGMLLEELEKSGLRENTLVIYLGDHGQDIIRGKRSSYEGGTRVPLIIYCPPEILGQQATTHPEGLVVDELVTMIDLLPTFQELTGIEVSPGLPGRSLLPLLSGEQAEWREYLFTEFHMHSGHNFYPQRTVRDSRYKLIHNLLYNEVNPDFQFTMNKFIDEDAFYRELEKSPSHIREAYTLLRDPPEYELYDLQNDPYEFHNLAGQADVRSILEGLKAELQQWQEQTDDPLRFDKNLRKLKAEVDSCFITGEYIKKDKWYYPEYFSEKQSTGE